MKADAAQGEQTDPALRLVADLPGVRRAADQTVGNGRHPRLTVVRLGPRKLVLKHLDPGGMLCQLPFDLAREVVDALPRQTRVVLAPVRVGGRRVHERGGASFMLFPLVATAPEPHPFEDWRRNTSTFVRFQEDLRRDLAGSGRLAPALRREPKATWLDLGSTDWPWSRTAEILGEARAGDCEERLEASADAAAGLLDTVGHRDVVARNVASRRRGGPVLFDLDDLGLATTWTDALTSAIWAGFDAEALVFVIERLRRAVGRRPARGDLAVALRLVIRRLSDELGALGGRSVPDGYVAGHQDRIDRLLFLFRHC